jgi:hypothetical protein
VAIHAQAEHADALPREGRERGAIHAMLVSRVGAVYHSLTSVLSGRQVCLCWETSPERAVEMAKIACCPVLLVTAETDWCFVVKAFGQSPTRPNVIVLLPTFDLGLWVMGYDAGAFDVLPIDVDGERLTATLIAAQRRWERRRLVYEARARNPFAASLAAR